MLVFFFAHFCIFTGDGRANHQGGLDAGPALHVQRSIRAIRLGDYDCLAKFHHQVRRSLE